MFCEGALSILQLKSKLKMRVYSYTPYTHTRITTISQKINEALHGPWAFVEKIKKSNVEHWRILTSDNNNNKITLNDITFIYSYINTAKVNYCK